jgi:hypothetical protein
MRGFPKPGNPRLHFNTQKLLTAEFFCGPFQDIALTVSQFSKDQTMSLRPIRNEDDHAAALRQIEGLWGAASGTPEGNLLEVLVDLVEHYEDRRFPLAPIAA